jgi:hypothetical protein
MSLKLYRGDKKGNITKPEYHGSAGLLTKQINSGDPAYISKAGLVDALRVHIAPASIPEEDLQSRSHFLSFSADQQCALSFAADGRQDNLLPGEGNNQRYLFILDIDSRVATQRSGVFFLPYECSLRLCEHCTPAKQTHHLLLIDVVTFLSANNAYARSGDALHNAGRDSEWLALPIDYIPRLNGYGARIVPSLVWDVEYYFLTS